jgi:hypothetical protein
MMSSWPRPKYAALKSACDNTLPYKSAIYLFDFHML